MAHLYKVSSITDFYDYLKIKSDPTAIIWSGFDTAPDPEKLKIHFENLLNERIPKGDILLFLKDDETDELILDDIGPLTEEQAELVADKILSQIEESVKADVMEDQIVGGDGEVINVSYPIAEGSEISGVINDVSDEEVKPVKKKVTKATTTKKKTTAKASTKTSTKAKTTKTTAKKKKEE